MKHSGTTQYTQANEKTSLSTVNCRLSIDSHMKKSITKLLTLSFIFLFCLNSCQKDGVYKPKKKISRVVTKAELIYDGFTNVTTSFAENWVWENNQLFYIQDDNGLSEFFYEENKISKIINDGQIIYFYYQNSRLESIEINSFGRKVYFIVEERENGKITKFRTESDDYFERGKTSTDLLASFEEVTPLLRLFLADPIVDVLRKEYMTRYHDFAESKGKVYAEVELTYDGNNVVKQKISYSEEVVDEDQATYIFIYDDKKNPYYHSLYHLIFGAEASMGLVFSENNILSYYEESSPEDKVTYQYTYSGDWPQTQSFSEEFDSGYYMYTYIFRKTFSYEE